jgi:hypothetical protein
MKKDIARGRAFEKWVADRYGLRRRGGALAGCDVLELPGEPIYPLGIEAKAYERLQLRTSWVTQARANATKEGRQFWAIFQRPKGWSQPVVTIDESFFYWLWNEATNTEGEE